MPKLFHFNYKLLINVTTHLVALYGFILCTHCFVYSKTELMNICLKRLIMLVPSWSFAFRLEYKINSMFCNDLISNRIQFIRYGATLSNKNNANSSSSLHIHKRKTLHQKFNLFSLSEC